MVVERDNRTSENREGEGFGETPDKQASPGLVGLLDGLIMAVKKKAVPCPDGTFFPEGTTDFACYVHPQAGVGVAIAALSVVLGILVVFSSIVVRASLDADRCSP